MRTVFILCLLLIGTFCSRVFSQTDAQLSMYWEMPSYYNPASVAQNDNLRVAALNRMQWVGVTNAPTTFIVTAESPFKLLKKRHGVGVSIVSDKLGLFSTTFFSLQYAYRLQLWGGNLSLGLSLGAVDQSFDGSGVFIPDTDDHNPSDEAIPSESVSAMGFDAGFGAWFTRDIYYAGISSTHLSQTTLDLDESSSTQLKRAYYFTGGCNIEMRNPLYELQPSFLLKTDLQATQMDISVRVLYDKKIFGGISYRWKDAVILTVGGEYKGVRLAYCYDISTSQMAKASDGSHELFASYIMKLKLDSKAKNKHKSIRVL